MDLVNYTKGYFDRSVEDQENLVNVICAEVLLKLATSDVTLKDMNAHIESILKTAESKEDYETAKVLTLVKEKLNY